MPDRPVTEESGLSMAEFLTAMRLRIADTNWWVPPVDRPPAETPNQRQYRKRKERKPKAEDR